MNSKRYLLSGIIGLALLLALVFINRWAFSHWLGMSYLRWYARNGSLISMGFTFVTLIIDLDKNRDLISSHPFRYASACLWLMAVPVQTLGIEFKRDNDTLPQPEAVSSEASGWNAPLRMIQSLMYILESFISGAFAIVFLVAILAWLLLIAPVQYFVYLVCGAPARAIGKSTKKTWYTIDEAGMHMVDVPKHEAAPEGAIESDYFNKPVRMTSALAIIVLWALSKAF